MSHRRNRHLNPKSCGAVVSLDSRFIRGFSDGDLLSSWEDRKGSVNNGVSQASDALKPTYKTRIQGGNPVVRFNNDYLESAASFGTNNSLSGNPAVTIILLHKKTTSTAGSCFGWGNTSVGLNAIGLFDNTTPFIAFSGGQNRPITTVPTNQFIIHSFLKIAGAINLMAAFRNGINVNSGTASASTPNINGANALIVGGWANSSSNRLVGDIGSLLIYARRLSVPERKRQEICLAFSFKIKI